MLKKALGLILATTGLAAATPAWAGEYLDLVPPTGVYGNLDVTCETTAPCAFTNLFSFVTPTGYSRVSVDITSISISPETNIDFALGSVTLNGVALVFDHLAGIEEHGSLLNQLITPGETNVLSVSGFSGGHASYAGTLAFGSVVPEPGTWMLMVLGIGAVGMALRNRKQVANRTAFA